MQAIAIKHREELMAAHALCVVYRAILEAAGIPAPTDLHGAEALRRCRAIFRNAGLDGDPLQARDLTDDWSEFFNREKDDERGDNTVARA